MRQTSLDGLRGILALSVVTHHMFERLHVGEGSDAVTTPGHIAHAAFSFIFHPGPFAVFVFFVISGFVLAGVLDRPRLLADRWYWPATRYLRLTLPMAFALFVSAALQTVVLGADDATPLMALRDGFWGVYVDHDHRFFDFVVWSMKVELVGSIMLFILYLFRPSQTNLLLAAFGVYIGGGSILIGFALGAWAYERQKVKPWTFSLPIGLAVTVAALGLEILGETPEARYYGAMIGGHSLGNRNGAQDAVAALAATMLVITAIGCAPIRTWLSSRLPQFLGRISFSLYLIHVPILLTIFANVPADGVAQAPWALKFLSIAVLAGMGMTLAIDEPVVRMLHTFRPKHRTQVTLPTNNPKDVLI